MSTNAGAAGVFGILLCGITEIEPLWKNCRDTS